MPRGVDDTVHYDTPAPILTSRLANGVIRVLKRNRGQCGNGAECEACYDDASSR
jgi:hypothetical protein